jgi:TRAP-type mannitol/chloroaromatic compound transport system permease large subunit
VAEPAVRPGRLLSQIGAPPHSSRPDIFRGFLPFIGIQLLVLALVLVFPEITRVFL